MNSDDLHHFHRRDLCDPLPYHEVNGIELRI
jgi:hypothetical protein